MSKANDDLTAPQVRRKSIRPSMLQIPGMTASM